MSEQFISVGSFSAVSKNARSISGDISGLRAAREQGEVVHGISKGRTSLLSVAAEWICEFGEPSEIHLAGWFNTGVGWTQFVKPWLKTHNPAKASMIMKSGHVTKYREFVDWSKRKWGERAILVEDCHAEIVVVAGPKGRAALFGSALIVPDDQFEWYWVERRSEAIDSVLAWFAEVPRC
jgi:hypothetical protein